MTKDDIRELIKGIFGLEVSNDDDIVDWYLKVHNTAIAEHAKKISVAFMRWNSHMYTEGRDRQKDQWFDHRGECVAKSTPELFDQFDELIIKQESQSWLFIND